MMFAADSLATPAYYDALANKLEAIALEVRDDPEIEPGYVEHLMAIAKEIRQLNTKVHVDMPDDRHDAA